MMTKIIIRLWYHNKEHFKQYLEVKLSWVGEDIALLWSSGPVGVCIVSRDSSFM